MSLTGHGGLSGFDSGAPSFGVIPGTATLVSEVAKLVAAELDLAHLRPSTDYELGELFRVVPIADAHANLAAPVLRVPPSLSERVSCCPRLTPTPEPNLEDPAVSLLRAPVAYRPVGKNHLHLRMLVEPPRELCFHGTSHIR